MQTTLELSLSFHSLFKQCEFSANGLATSHGSTDEHVFVRGIKHLEKLCLDCVGRLDDADVDRLILFVVQRRDR